VKVRYTRRALRQMTEVLDYIEARSPSGTENVKRWLQDVIDVPADHPNSGHETNKKNLRRFVVSPYPCAIFTVRMLQKSLSTPFATLQVPPLNFKRSRLVDSGYVIL
jgi:toxin ParE1/3/4